MVQQLPSQPKTTRPRGDRRKAEIIQTATDVFSRQGYGRTSLATVASAVGITEPGLLHHFRTKEELLLAVLRERDHDDGRRLARAASQDGLGMLDALAALVEHNVTARGLSQLYSVLVAESLAGEQPGREFFVERYTKIRRWMVQSLRAGQAHGEIRPEVDVEAVVPVLIAVMDGLQLQWLLEPRELDMMNSFTTFSAMVRHWLSTDTAGRSRQDGAAIDP